MKNKIVALIGILAAIALFFIIRNISFAPVEITPENQGTGIEKIKINPEISDITLPLSNNPKDAAWAVFQTYLNYNKNRNLEGVKSVVYKIASVCEDPKTRIDCEDRMGSAYAYGLEMKKEDFTNVWSDEKQIILSTDFWIEDNDEMNFIGRFRSILFFIRDSENNIRLLSWSPTQGGATAKGTASQEELEERITRWSEDNDQDGIADYSEECLDKPNDEACVKTNPKSRDTNSNGWWDGVEALMD